MLRWLTWDRFSVFDAVWMIWAALAWHDRQPFAWAVALVVGAFLSGCLTAWSKQRIAAGEQTP